MLPCPPHPAIGVVENRETALAVEDDELVPLLQHLDQWRFSCNGIVSITFLYSGITLTVSRYINLISSLVPRLSWNANCMHVVSLVSFLPVHTFLPLRVLT